MTKPRAPTPVTMHHSRRLSSHSLECVTADGALQVLMAECSAEDQEVVSDSNPQEKAGAATVTATTGE